MSPILFSQDSQLTSMAANTPLNFNQDHIANYQPSSLAPKSFMFHTTSSEISHPPTNASVNFNNDFSLGQTSSLNFEANPIPPGSSQNLLGVTSNLTSIPTTNPKHTVQHTMGTSANPTQQAAMHFPPPYPRAGADIGRGLRGL